MRQVNFSPLHLPSHFPFGVPLFIFSRFSCFFLPRARPISALIFLPKVWMLSGMSVRPFLPLCRPDNLFLFGQQKFYGSLLRNFSSDARSELHFRRSRHIFGLIGRNSHSHQNASPPLTVALEAAKEPCLFRKDFTSRPSNSKPASSFSRIS